MALTKRIIPCLDVKGGRVVKGTRFVQIKDAGDPVNLAKQYSDQGADELVFLDITASAERRETIKELVRGVASVIDIPFTVGGGVASMQDARNILLSGADKVGINTGAINNPTVITDMMNLFGRQCVVVAIDARRNYTVPENTSGSLHDVVLFEEDNGRVIDNCDDTRDYTRDYTRDNCDPKFNTIYDNHSNNTNNNTSNNTNNNDTHKSFWFEVHTYGGKKGTGIDAIQWAKEAQRRGAGEILLTSMDRDGTKDGYDAILTKAVVDAVSIPVIASGGCGHPLDMAKIFEATDVDAALAASIFHYQEHGVAGVKKILQEKGIPVRL